MPDSYTFGHRLLFPQFISHHHPSSSCLNFLKNKAGLSSLCYKVVCQWLQACVHLLRPSDGLIPGPLAEFLSQAMTVSSLITGSSPHRREWIELARTQ